MDIIRYIKTLIIWIIVWIIVEIMLGFSSQWFPMIGVALLFYGLTKLAFQLGILTYRGDFLGNVDLSHVSKTWIKIPVVANIPNQTHKISSGSEYYWSAIYKAKVEAKVVGKQEIKKEVEEDGKQKVIDNIKKEANIDTKPYMILAHGMGGVLEDLELMAAPLAMNGYHVVSFNQTGHGFHFHRSPGNGLDYTNVMTNIHDIVEYVLQQKDLAYDSNGIPRIGFIGGSTGGIMSLTQAYLNPKIKVTVALSHIHDFHELMSSEKDYPFFSRNKLFLKMLKSMGVKMEYTAEENKMISPMHCLTADPSNKTRVFIVHCENDPLPFTEALKSKALANLPDENCLFLKFGGHAFRGQETIVSATVYRWLQQNL